MNASPPNVAPPSNAEGVKKQLSTIIAQLSAIKDTLLLIGFFGAGAIWVINYFATRDQLEQLECFTKLNVRMLQANANVEYTQQLSKDGRNELREQQRLLRQLPSVTAGGPEADGPSVIQARIDELQAQSATFTVTIQSESNTSKKGLAALLANSCLLKEQRKRLLEELRTGSF
jgi:hypothetical protein